MNTDRWARIAESGSMAALRFAAAFHRILGRRPTLALAWLASAYFFVRNRHARGGSRQYLERVWATPEGRIALGRRPNSLAVLRHLFEFSVNLYDRMLVWGGALDHMTVEHDGSEAIFELAKSGRGALLLGSHFGSIDMLWFLSRKYDLVVNVVVFYDNAERINAFFESLSPDARLRAIDIDPDSVDAAFQIRSCIDRGEFVVIMADRTAPGKSERSVLTTFLGRPARFPLAPFLLPCVLGCPALLALCVRTGESHYQTVLRPLSAGGRAMSGERDKRARELLGRYVTLVESFCLSRPYQWFNFYEFFEEDGR